MNKKQSILAAFFMLVSANLSYCGERTANLGRYTVIVNAFNAKNKKFEPGFRPAINDVDVVKTRQTHLKEELKNQKKVTTTSWAPTLLNILGIGFSLESIRQAILGGYVATDMLTNFGPKIRPTVAHSTNALGYINYPISYPTGKAVGAARKKLLDTITNSEISVESHKKAIDAIYITSPILTSLVTAGIAKYFFNKAASYKNEVSELEKEIALDDAMIAALQAAQ